MLQRRYLSFAKFAFLLESAKLHFTRVDQFDDHFEGAWPKSDLEHWTKDRMIDVFKVPDFTEHMRRSRRTFGRTSSRRSPIGSPSYAVVGPGTVHRVCLETQRRFFDPPDLGGPGVWAKYR
jgi:hypothetical protein